MSRRPTLSPEERQEKLDAAHQRLIEAVGELRSSEDWLGYLAAMGRFHTYSASNALLIFIQRPDATRVAGFQTWKTLGRSVKKGAKGIAIFAPVTRWVEAEEPATSVPDGTGPTVKRVVGFRLAYVFDLADTEGQPLPKVSHVRLLDGEAPDRMWEALAQQVQCAGYRLEVVHELADVPSANGVTKRDQRVVQIASAGRSRAAQVKTLAHELAHVLLHQEVDYSAQRNRVEVEAESVAYLVCNAWGLDSMDYTLGYVTNWANGNVEVVLATANTVQRCATGILALDPPDAAEQDDGQERGAA